MASSPNAAGCQSFTVVGVTPPGFTGLEVGRSFDIILPVCAAGLWGTALDQKHYWWLTVMGRLKGGWDVETASDHVRTISPALFDATVPSGYSAESTARYRGFRLGVRSAARGVSFLREDYGRPLWLLFGMTGLVLLITCGNLATLMLARARERAREISVRVALGASRARIVSQLSLESLVVAAIGAVLSVPVALAAGRTLVRFLSTSTNPVHLELTADWRVAGFATAIALCTAVAFGLAPALPCRSRIRRTCSGERAAALPAATVDPCSSACSSLASSPSHWCWSPRRSCSLEASGISPT